MHRDTAAFSRELHVAVPGTADELGEQTATGLHAAWPRVLICGRMAPPDTMHWLFWDVDLEQLEVERHAEYILSRVLDRGRIDDVSWALQTYGEDRIHAFLCERPRAELSPRTLAFWRAFFREEQPWPTRPSSRQISSAPWHG